MNAPDFIVTFACGCVREMTCPSGALLQEPGMRVPLASTTLCPACALRCYGIRITTDTPPRLILAPRAEAPAADFLDGT